MEVTENNKPNDKITALDETNHTSVTALGTTLVNPDQPRVVIKDQKANMQSTRAQRHLEDVDWTLKKQLDRFNFVDTFSWSVGDAQDTVLKDYEVPFSLIVSKLATTPFTTFKYVHFDYMAIHIQLQGTRFQNGRLIAYFYPTCQPNYKVNASLQDDTRKNRVLLSHVFLDPSQSEPGVIKVPFSYFQGWLDIKAGDNLGNLRIAVFNPLTAAVETSTTATIRIFANLENAQFRVPLAAAKPPAIIRDGEMRVRGIAQSALLGAVDEVTQDITKTLMPIAQIIDIFGHIFDRRDIRIQPPPLINKKMQYLSNVRNDQYVEGLTWEPDEMQLADKEHYGTSINEMSLDYLLKEKWNWTYTGSYGTSSTTGEVLWGQAVGPMATINPTITTELSTIDYLARKFEYWRGSFIIGVDVVSGPFHEGSLSLVYLPGTPDTILDSTIDYDLVQSQYFATFQLKGGQNSFAVKVPYLSQTPYKTVYSGQNISANPENQRNFFCGTIALVVNTPLKVTGTVPSTVSFNVFIAAGPDFELSVPTFTNSSISLRPPEAYVVGEKQSAPVSFNDSPTVCTSTVLCGDQESEVSDPKVKHFSDRCTDLQSMLKRYQNLGVVRTSLAGQVAAKNISQSEADDILAGAMPLILQVPLSYTYSPTAKTMLHNTNFLTDISSIFRLARNPSTFKILGTGFDHGLITYIIRPETNTNLYLQQYLHRFFPNAQGLDSLGGTIMPMTFISPDHVAEFKLPYLHQKATTLIPKKYDLPLEQKYDTNTTILLVALYGFTSLEATFDLTVFGSFSDESSFGLFTGLPPIQFDTANGVSQYPDSWLGIP